MQCVSAYSTSFLYFVKAEHNIKNAPNHWSVDARSPVNQYLKFKYVKIVTMHFSCGVNEAEAETKK